MPKWMKLEQGAVGSLILRLLKPSRWCQYRSSGIYRYPSTRPVDFNRQHLPNIASIHVNFREEFVVLWGTTNHIFVFAFDDSRARH
jgi:hypothetical protein